MCSKARASEQDTSPHRVKCNESSLFVDVCTVRNHAFGISRWAHAQPLAMRMRYTHSLIG